MANGSTFSQPETAAGKVMQIYKLPLKGGEAGQITQLPQGVTLFALSPDGSKLAFVTKEKPAAERKPFEPIEITRLNYRFDPIPGYVQDIDQALYVMSADGGESKALTAHDGLILMLDWSPDNQKVLIAVSCAAESTQFGLRPQLSIVHLSGRD